jgi:hypothetical protein
MVELGRFGCLVLILGLLDIVFFHKSKSALMGKGLDPSAIKYLDYPLLGPAKSLPLAVAVLATLHTPEIVRVFFAPVFGGILIWLEMVRYRAMVRQAERR